MKQLYKKSIGLFCLLVIVFFLNQSAKAQTTISTPLSGNYLYNSTTADGAIVFGVKNTNANSITLTNVGNYTPAGFTGTLTLWRHETAVTGAPTAITTANGWVSTATSALTNTTEGLTNVFSSLNVVIPAGATFRFAVSGPPSSPFYAPAGSTLNSYIIGGVELMTAANPNSPGYGGAFPGPPANTPRCFQGSISFKVNPSGVANNASALTLTSPNNFCAGNQDVKVKVLNNGNNIINTVQVNWEVDGMLQTPINWTTPIDVSGSTNGNEAIVTLGNINFANAAKTIRAWTSLPNGVADAVPADDQVISSLRAKMSGIYTIGGSSPDFTTLNSAITALSGGICGPVTLSLAPSSGPYTEQVTIPVIAGTSATNRVTIDGNNNTLQFAPVTAARHILKLENADYVIIKNLTVKGLATDFGYGIHLMYGSDRDSIVNCTIDMSAVTATTQAASGGIVASNSTTTTITTGNNASYLTIMNNTIKGAYQGIILYGNTDGTNAVGNRILNNEIVDFYANGIELNNNDGSLVQGNNIHRTTRTGTVAAFEGVELGTGNKNVVVNANRIHDTHTASSSPTTTAYGVFLTGCDAVAGSENRVTNNLIYNFNATTTGAQYGLANTGSDGAFYYHNTVVLDGPGSTGVARGFYQTTLATNIKVQNNIFRVSRSGTGLKYCLYFNTTTSTIASNNNVLYSTGGIGSLSTTGYNTLVDWKAANSNAYDQQSVSVDPLFNNAGTFDYTPFEAAVNGVGVNVGVTTDITGATRSTIAPDPGAYEFSVAGLDAAIGWVAPVTTSVTPGMKTITVSIANTQTTPITAVNLSYTDGVVLQTQNFTGLNIAAGATQQLSFTTQYNLTASARLKAYINSVNGIADNSQLNDTTANQIFCLPLAGAYTIDNAMPTTGTNFNSFNDAVNQLICSGISAAVTFYVQPGSFGGVYTEQVTIPAITGASATKKVTFKGNQHTLQFAPVTANRHVIKLDGADHIVIDSLNITTTATDFGWGIHLINGADSNIIKHCIIDITATTSTTESSSGGIVFSGSTTVNTTAGNANFNLIDSNEVKGAYKGIVINGATTGLGAVKNRITNNIVRDFYANGIELTNNDSIVVAGNDISRAARAATTTFTGIELGAGNKKSIVNANRVHDTHNTATSQTGTAYGIHVTGDDATVGNENIISNNLIYNFNSSTTGAQYGLANTGSDGAFYYHNTVVLDGPGSTGIVRGFYQTTAATNIQVVNNLIAISRAGTGLKYCLYFGTTTSTIVSNNNALYNSATSGTNGIGSFGTTGFTALTDWKTANSNAYDQASASTDPLFASPGGGDYTPMAPAFNNIGANVGIVTDILGNTRTATPDPGAYEFDLGGCSNPAIAGNAIASDTIACAGSTFMLDLLGNSTGAGQTYQWQSSPDNSAWTNIGTVQTTTSYTASQALGTTYYRCVVKCASGTPVNSTSIRVVSPTVTSGVFTINNAVATGGSNFQTFTDAVNRIKCGINGPVVFNVVANSGPYNEQVIIPDVPGTSSINTITVNGNGTTVTYLSNSSNERAVIKLKGTDYVTIDSLVIQPQGSAAIDYGYGIQLVDDADHNTIKRCSITTTSTPATAASTAFAGIVINASSAATPIATGISLCDSNTIHKNTIIGGYCGIAVTANGITSTMNGNNITDNTVTDFYIYGISVNGSQRAVISGNDISRPSRSSIGAFYGIDVNGAVGLTITRNKIHGSHFGATTATTAAYGIYHSVSDATSVAPNIVSNNMVYGFNNLGSQYGIYNSGSDSIKYFHNSVYLDNQSATTSNTYDTRCFYQVTAATGIELKNNIFYISRNCIGENHCVYFSTAGTTFTSDYNNLLITSTAGTLNNLAYANATQYTNLAAWQAYAGTPDTHSKNVDPMFISASDLHLMGSSPLDDQGTAIPQVTVDIDGQARSASTPDIGADELPPVAGLDMRPDALVTPSNANGCYTTETITVRVKNNSTSTINFATNPVTVAVAVTGAATANYSAVVSTGTLASSATIDVTMATPSATLAMTANGTYNFAISTSVIGDVNASNDLLNVTKEKVPLAVGSVTTSKDAYCVTGGTPTFTATGILGYSAIKWQQSTTSGAGFIDIPGATSNPYTLTNNITQTTYFRIVATCGTQAINSDEDTVLYANPTITSTVPATRCGAGTVNLSATGTGPTIAWYANAAGGTPLGTGNTFTTPTISSTTTYYVAASDGGSTFNAGKLAPEATATATVLSTYGHVITLNKAILLNSVQVFSTTGTAITISLYNSDGTNQLMTTGSRAVVAGTSPHISLGWTIPAGTYRLAANGMTGNFYRDGVTTPSVIYPMALGTAGQINGYHTSITGALTTGFAYYFMYNLSITDGCESTRTAVTATVDCSVPISLLNFKGERSGSLNKLQWATSTEVNNAGFELQRSADGSNFSSLVFMASKAVNGNSNAALNYSFDDVKPLLGNGYYRLRQVDRDGKSSYSNIVLIKGNKVGSLTISSLYPNPVTDRLNLVLTSPNSENVALVVTDLVGKVVIIKNQPVVAGDNNYQLDVSHLSAGSYFIKAVCANGCETAVQKFVK